MSLVPTRPVPPGDDLDRMLRAFYRKEMPAHWPAPPVPPPAPTIPFRRPTPRSRTLFRSRLALVASVALLVLGSLVVSGKVAPDRMIDPNGIPVINPEAKVNPELRRLRKDARPDKIKTSLSLEQDPAGETQIKVDARMQEDVPPSR